MIRAIVLLFYINQTDILHISVHIFWLALVIKYIQHYPYVNYKMTHIFCFLLISLEISNILFTVWEYTDLIH